MISAVISWVSTDSLLHNHQGSGQGWHYREIDSKVAYMLASWTSQWNTGMQWIVQQITLKLGNGVDKAAFLLGRDNTWGSCEGYVCAKLRDTLPCGVPIYSCCHVCGAARPDMISWK